MKNKEKKAIDFFDKRLDEILNEGNPTKAQILDAFWKATAKLSNEAQPQPDALAGVINWVAYDFMNLKTRPKKYDKYLICRKDGKIHWETWNGSGWAYNEKAIKYWAEIEPPCL